MDSSAIAQLEDDYLSGMKCSLLLRKALRVATILNDEKMIAFCQREIKGFKDNPDDFPEYRYGHFNYYVKIRGIHCPLQVPPKFKDIFKIFYETLAIKQPISELEDRLRENHFQYQIQISNSLKSKIRDALSLPNDCDLIPYISKSYFEEFIESIRSIIGKWIANVKKGCIANDNSFIINNYNQTIEKVFTTDFDHCKSTLKNNLSDIEISTEKQNEIMSLFSDLQTAIQQKNKNEGLNICNIIRMILVGAAANLLSDGIKLLIHAIIFYFTGSPSF